MLTELFTGKKERAMGYMRKDLKEGKETQSFNEKKEQSEINKEKSEEHIYIEHSESELTNIKKKLSAFIWKELLM